MIENILHKIALYNESREHKNVFCLSNTLGFQIFMLLFVSYYSYTNTIKAVFHMENKSSKRGSSHHGLSVTNLTSIHEDAGLIPGITPWVKDPALF